MVNGFSRIRGIRVIKILPCLLGRIAVKIFSFAAREIDDDPMLLLCRIFNKQVNSFQYFFQKSFGSVFRGNLILSDYRVGEKRKNPKNRRLAKIIQFSKPCIRMIDKEEEYYDIMHLSSPNGVSRRQVPFAGDFLQFMAWECLQFLCGINNGQEFNLASLWDIFSWDSHWCEKSNLPQ